MRATTAAARAAVLLLLTAAVLMSAPPAHAQSSDTGWTIESFDAAITVHPDGSMDVVENIVVDFANLQRHGIFRVIPVRYDLVGDDVRIEIPEGRRAGDFVRAIEVSDIRVSSSAPDDVQISRPGPVGASDLSLRIGSEDETVSGRQTYQIAYTVRGALNAFEGHGELYWNVTGNGWPVPILQARAVIRAPRISAGACFRGPVGSSALCDRVNVRDRAAVFQAVGLPPGEGLTVVTAFPPAAVEVPPPILLERWTLRRALVGSPLAVPLTAATSLLAIAIVALLLYRQGRDRVTRGGVTIDGRIDDVSAEGERKGLFAPRVTPVQFRPPEDLRPAQLGVLVDERVDPVDISATIVDLAVRGHLRIVEDTSKFLWVSRTSWTLERRENADDQLLGYEQRLLSALFKTGPSVELASLKGTFASDYKAVQGQVYDDAKARGWFPRRPDRVRTLWLVLGIAVELVSLGIFVVALLFSTVALAAVPLVVLGWALLIAHRWMPHRTPAGSKMLDQALGFREYITTAEAGRAEFAEQQNLFVQLLPYAVVFGAVAKWAQAFEGLDVLRNETIGYWYAGSHPDGFGIARFSSGLSDFSTQIGGTLPVAPASSGGSGFSGGGGSGGGFGGGGGGSW